MLSLELCQMKEEMLFNVLRSRYFDGVVLISSDTNDPPPLFLKEADIPYTRIGYDPNMDDLITIDVDNFGGARKAVAHLASLGHQRIACIKGPPWKVCTPAHYEGYKKALEEASFPLDPDLADIHYIPFAAHNVCSPIGTIASAHVCAAIRTFLVLEFHSQDVPWWNAMVGRAHDPLIKDGHLALDDTPELGIELDDELCRQHVQPGALYFGEAVH